MNKQHDLCGACAQQMKEGYTLKKICGGISNKVTCSHCGKRRYGATYELAKKEAGK